MKKLSLILLSVFLFPIFIYAEQLIITGGTVVDDPSISAISYNNNNGYGIFVEQGSTLKLPNILDDFQTDENSEGGIGVVDNSTMSVKMKGDSTKLLVQSNLNGIYVSNNSYLDFMGSGTTYAIFSQNKDNSIYVANNSTFTIKKFESIEIENDNRTGNGIKLQKGTLVTDNISLKNNKIGILAEKDDNFFKFGYLEIENNECGIKAENGAKLYFNYNTTGSSIVVNSNDIGIYSSGNSEIISDTKIYGESNNILLKVDSGGKIIIDKVVISSNSNTIGIYSKDETSLIHVNSFKAVENSSASIVLENGGFEVDNNIELVENAIGIFSNGAKSVLKVKDINAEGNETTIQMESGTIEANNINVKNNGTGTAIQINGGTITATNAIDISSNAIAIQMVNGQITAKSIIMNGNTTAIEIKNGKIQVTDNIVATGNEDAIVSGGGNDGKIVFSKATLNDNNYGIHSKNQSNVNIEGTVEINNSKTAGVYANENSTITINGHVEGSGNPILLHANNGSEIKVGVDIDVTGNDIGLYSTGENSKITVNKLDATGDVNAINIEDKGRVKTGDVIIKNNNSSASITIKEGGILESNKIEIDNNKNSAGTILLTSGTIDANEIDISNSTIGFFVQGTDNNLLFSTLKLNENDYGIFVNSQGYDSVLNISNRDSVIELNNSKQAGIYSGVNSSITINAQILGEGNKSLLKAENGGKIYVENDLHLSTNTISLYSNGSDSVGNCSLISVSSVTVEYSTYGVIIENGGQFISEKAWFKNNYVGMNVVGTGDEENNILKNSRINFEGNVYGLLVSNGAVLDIENSTITFNNSKNSAINISGGATLKLSSSSIQGEGNKILVNVENSGTFKLESSLDSSNNDIGIKIDGSGEAYISSNLDIRRGTNAVVLSNGGKFSLEQGSVVNLADNYEAGLLFFGLGVVAGVSDVTLNLEHNKYGIEIIGSSKSITEIGSNIGTLNIINNEYGVYSVDHSSTDVNIQGIVNFTVSNNDVAFYAKDGSNIKIYGNDKGYDISNNKTFLKAEQNSSITLEIGPVSETREDENNPGIYALDNSKITLDEGQTGILQISKKKNGVVLENGGVIEIKQGNKLEVIGNKEAGVLILSGQNNKIEGSGTIVSQKNKYGLMLSSSANLSVNLATSKLKMQANEADIYVTDNSTMTITGGNNQSIDEGMDLSKILLKAENGKIEVEQNFDINNVSEMGALATGENSLIQFDKNLTLSKMDKFGLVAQNGGKIIVSSTVTLKMTGVGIYSNGENSEIEISEVTDDGSNVNMEKLISAVDGGNVSVSTLNTTSGKVALALSAESKGKVTADYVNIFSKNKTVNGVELKNGGAIELNSGQIQNMEKAINVVGIGNKIISTNINFYDNNYAIAVAANETSELTIEKSSITFSGNNTGIYVGENGKVIIGEDVTVVGDKILFKADKGIVEISSQAKNFEIEGSSVAIQLANGGTLKIDEEFNLLNNGTGILVEGTTGNIEGGKLIINAQDSQTGIKLLNGTLNIKGSILETANVPVVALSGNSKLNLEDVSLNLGENIALVRTIDSSIINIKDSEMEVGNNLVKADAITEVQMENSKVTGAINNDGENKKNINVNIDSNSQWMLDGNAQINRLTMTSGAVLKLSTATLGNEVSKNKVSAIGSRAGASGYNTLTVKELINNSNDKAKLEFAADLKNQKADTLKIEQAIEGKYDVGINYIDFGDIGSKVKIIDTEVENGRGRAKQFYYSQEIDAYEYSLKQGSQMGYTSVADRYSWYLVQSEKRTDAFNTINNTPEVMSLVFKSGMNSLNRRLGDIRRTPEDSYSGVWARGFGKNYDVTSEIKTTVNVFGVEGGYDFRVKKDSDDRYYLGLMVGYQSVGSIKTQQTNDGSDGHGDGSAPSFGAYGSWIGQSGWFVDLAIRYFMIDLKMTSYSNADEAIGYKPKANYIGFSGEFGKEVEIDINTEGKLRLEPKVELIFGTAGAQSSQATTGTKLEYGGTTVLNGKLKVAGSYQFELENEMLLEPIIELGYGTEMAGKTDITYGQGKYTSDFSGGYFEVSGGLNAYLTKGFSAYSLVTMESGDKQSNFGWNIGVRYGFGGSKQIVNTSEKEKKTKNKTKEQKYNKDKKENIKRKGTIQNRRNEENRMKVMQESKEIEEIKANELEKAVIRKDGIRQISIDGRIAEKEIGKRNRVEANDLTQGQKEYIMQLASQLAEDEDVVAIGVAGHVIDTTGDETENRKHSLIKAKRVKKILMEAGIEAGKIKVRGYGSKKQVASNTTREGRIKNDRVEIIIKR